MNMTMPYATLLGDPKRPPFNHDYHQMCTYYIGAVAQPYKPMSTPESALEHVKTVQQLTRGIRQQVWLGGWQHRGSDTGYPDWSEVCPIYKRPQDATAGDSLMWLMREARNYNAVMTVHVNMCDAYPDSPLWETYVKEGLICQLKDGSFKKAGVWEGLQSYHVCKSREWASGYLKRRMDGLLDLLPPILENGTVHVDVFNMHPSEYHGTTWEEERDAMVEILKYWKARGVDQTGEWFFHEWAGLMPMAWHFNLGEQSRLKYPPWYVCGGGSNWNKRHIRNDITYPWLGVFATPEAGCLYEEAWGESNDAAGPHDLPAFADGFYRKTLPWYFLNRQRAVELRHSRESYAVHFTGDVVSSVRIADRHYTLHQGDRVLVDGTNTFVPALWRDKEIIAYSKTGSRREWELPPDWNSVRHVAVRGLWPLNTARTEELNVTNGRLVLTLQPGEAVYIEPV